MRRRLPAVLLAASFMMVPALIGSSVSASPDAPTLAPAARKVVGMLAIPRLGINVPIRVGTTDAVYDIGVGQYPGTARPGAEGNLVIGGHRTSGRRPFAQIQKLKVGDPIIVTSGGRTHTYLVTKSFVVKPTAMWITHPTAEPVITLFACHPRGSTSKRYVVRGVLQG